MKTIVVLVFSVLLGSLIDANEPPKIDKTRCYVRSGNYKSFIHYASYNDSIALSYLKDYLSQDYITNNRRPRVYHWILGLFHLNSPGYIDSTFTLFLRDKNTHIEFTSTKNNVDRAMEKWIKKYEKHGLNYLRNVYVTPLKNQHLRIARYGELYVSKDSCNNIDSIVHAPFDSITLEIIQRGSQFKRLDSISKM